MKVAYVDHPCSKEQKEKLIAEGYKVVDSRFMPSNLKEGDIYNGQKTEKPKTKSRVSRNRDK
jgi:hypothetical protein